MFLDFTAWNASRRDFFQYKVCICKPAVGVFISWHRLFGIIIDAVRFYAFGELLRAEETPLCLFLRFGFNGCCVDLKKRNKRRIYEGHDALLVVSQRKESWNLQLDHIIFEHDE